MVTVSKSRMVDYLKNVKREASRYFMNRVRNMWKLKVMFLKLTA